MNDFRKYQDEADDKIYEELYTHNNSKCLVKMFCGTGKSLLMRKCKSIVDKNLVVFVFPSLSLIDQFYRYYFHGDKSNLLRISSESKSKSTTDPDEIKSFLSLVINKIICVTYQSFNTLLDNLDGIKIDVCIFDEAHHAVGETYQRLIFENDSCEKQIFFTATPKNANGIIMYERGREDEGMCGKLVYDYPYLKGVEKGYLNPFEIRIDMYTENNNKSIYECIARAILESKNNRVLTFHADVNTDRDKSVTNFVDEVEFRRVFQELQEREYPTQKYRKITMIGLSAVMSVDKRDKWLKKFDKTKSNEVIIISSCETIGEGIDTKNANMCVFVDPKSSFVKIIQNIGRIVRKDPKVDKPKSTILIPCWVDKTKYLECNGDKEKCDEVIRSEMSEGGNFNGILNVCSALKQEDEDLYDICLHYPDTYSPQEIRSNLEKQGYVIDDSGEGYLRDTLEYLLETELDEDEFDTHEELIMNLAEDNDICIEVHTNSLENPIEKYNSECKSKETIRMYKYEDEEETKYHPIIHGVKNTRRDKDVVRGPNKERRLNLKVHTNPDTKVLWNITSDIDITKDVCSCVIDCEVVDKWEVNFQKLKEYIDENKKRPSQSSKDKDVKFLGSWLQNQNQNYKNKKWNVNPQERYDTWIKFLEEYKEYILSDDEIWYINFRQLKDYIDENNNRPNSCSKDDIEGFLGRWLQNQNHQYKNKKNRMNSPEKYDLWTQFLEEYKEYLLSDGEIWDINFQKLKEYIGENKKRPIKESLVKYEKFLGMWVTNQLNNYKNKIQSMKSQERYNTMTQFLEEYREYFTCDEEKWDINFQKLKDYIDENKRTPSNHVKNKDEKILAMWLSHHNTNYKNKQDGMKSQERYNTWTQFLEEYKEYLNSNEEKWNIKFNQLKEYIDKNKKRPPEFSKDNDVKFLGRWLQQQIQDYKSKNKGMKSQERYDLWSEFLEEYKEYLINGDEKWDINFQKIKDYIDKNKKRPSHHSRDNDVKFLGSWLQHQIKNYKIKKDGMKSQERYDIWTQFLEDYKEYFNKSDDTSEGSDIIKPKKSMKLQQTTKQPKKPKETCEQKRIRVHSELSQLHQRYKTLNSSNLSKEFNENPDLWHTYHTISEENEKSFPEQEIPRNRIIAELNKIKTKRRKIVVDMGCGKAHISQHYMNDSRFQFYNYDHISSNETIIPCDISTLPLEDDSVEICILSLAMWGSNKENYIQQAYRVLESGGKMYIIEPTKRWSEKDENGNLVVGQEGCKLKQLLCDYGFHILEEYIEKFSLFVCMKN